MAAASATSGEPLTFPAFGPLRLLVVQPTPFCNLDCDYCYLPSRDDRRRLPLELLERTLERVLESPFANDDFTLLWHAGEPLTMPIAFYDEATALIRSVLARRDGPPLRIVQSLQTNAMTIDAAWCDCFERNDIHVGVSLDGPAFLHDAHRRTRTGLPSHAASLRGIGWLQRRGIPFQVIAVLTDDALDHADTLFDFFNGHGMDNLAFNMEETEGENLSSTLSRPRSEARYQAFLERFWERLRAEPGALRLREFDEIAGLACGDQRLARTDMNHPFAIVNVDARGNFSTFDPELLSVATAAYGDFAFGNVITDSLESVVDSAKFQQVYSEIRSGVERCRAECEYFGLCGGGAGSNKYWERGTFDCSETQACRYRIKLSADVVMAGLERELELTS
ncbi:MAG: GRRM system radical SAM/SPASM domain protein [Cyanobium sp.]|nr:GRRM system radical SAM/SPASM domain protein [Synechococcus sp. CS-1333]PZV21087.1 MAG: GRRM system radical SAM/SPASM domain protein [Cyanobium sp.]